MTTTEGVSKGDDGVTTVRHKIGTREEWLAMRLELLKEEKEHTRRGDELAKKRQELPWVRIDKSYRFETDEGSASLIDLFRGRSQLLVYHLMFGPDYTAACPSCSAIADGFNGFQIHLANHDVMLWAVSRAPLSKLQAYKRRLEWTFPWASSFAATSISTTASVSVLMHSNAMAASSITMNVRGPGSLPVRGAQRDGPLVAPPR
jgi:predicted dithiol-disulfide oxidoreductase (DUF899 family)